MQIDIVADWMIFSAYIAIPLILVWYICNREYSPFPVFCWLIVGLFVSCGITNLAVIVDSYYFSVVKMGFALVSWVVVIALVTILPKLLLVNPDDLEREITHRVNVEREFLQKVIGLVRDVQIMQARWRCLIELSPDPVVVANLDGCITEVNASACQVLGYKREQFLSMNCRDLVPEEDLQKFDGQKKAMFEGKAKIMTEWVFKRGDGSLLDVEVSSTIFPIGTWLSFFRDISVKKKEEELRVRLNKLDALTLAKFL